MKFIGALGIDFKLLLANIANFVLLVYLLKKIAYKPILAFIQERTKKIVDGIKNAELAKTNLAQANTQREQILTSAHKEAQTIIDTAKTTAQQQADQLVETGRQHSEKVLQAAQTQIANERSEALKHAKQEVADLVIMASEKVLRKQLTPETNKTFIDNAINEINV
ncbi:MAG: F0F1 ATP synthase subunit B [Patescibacteria group bacterium]|jgi:F-type H+-transporting ATPase subunit b